MDDRGLAAPAVASIGALPVRLLEACRDEGFDFVGIASADVLDDARAAALEARRAGRLDGLHWMTPAWLERATDPGAFLPGARSVILLALPYRPPLGGDQGPGSPARGRIAAYAVGRDYHRVFESRLRRIARFIRNNLGADARPTVDYGPLLERPLAAASGIGWQGKSTMLLVPGVGPWTLLGAIATTLALPAASPLRKSCGSCTRCIVACPTGALDPLGNALDARLCLSYHTIENRGPIPRELREAMGDRIFGCDDCLTSCPVGRAHRTSDPGLVPRSPAAATPELVPLLALSPSGFAERFPGRAVMRAKRDGFLRNVCVAIGNVGSLSDLPALETALDDEAPLVRGHAAWAVGRLVARCPSPGAGVSARRAINARLLIESDDWVREELRLALGTLAG